MTAFVFFHNGFGKWIDGVRNSFYDCFRRKGRLFAALRMNETVCGMKA